MAKKQDFDKDIHLSSFDDLFQTDESRDEMKREKLMDIPISKIQDFPEHPYKVKDDENMVELVESVKTRGLIQPVLWVFEENFLQRIFKLLWMFLSSSQMHKFKADTSFLFKKL